MSLGALEGVAVGGSLRTYCLQCKRDTKSSCWKQRSYRIKTCKFCSAYVAHAAGNDDSIAPRFGDASVTCAHALVLEQALHVEPVAKTLGPCVNRQIPFAHAESMAAARVDVNFCGDAILLPRLV